MHIYPYDDDGVLNSVLKDLKMQFHSTDKCGKIISDFPKRIRSHNFRDKRNIMAVDSELKEKKVFSPPKTVN